MTTTLPTCAVRVILHAQDGTPDEGASVSASLTRFDGEAWRFVSPKPERATTDENGECTLHLWRNARGDTESQYLVKIRTSSGATLEMVATVPDVDTAYLRQISNLPAYPGRSLEQINVDAAIEAALQAQAYADEVGQALADLQNMAALDPANVEGVQAFTFEDENGVRHMGRIHKSELAGVLAPALFDMLKRVYITNPQITEGGHLFDLPAGYNEDNFILIAVSSGDTDFVLIGQTEVRGSQVFVPDATRTIAGLTYVATGFKT